MIYEMTLQTSNSYCDIMGMTVEDMSGFFDYLGEKSSNRSRLTDRQKDMMEENRLERQKLEKK